LLALIITSAIAESGCKTSRIWCPSGTTPRKWKDSVVDHFESYEQSYSNVAILYFMHKKKAVGERIASIYMDGIGTTNDGPDDTKGGGFGADGYRGPGHVRSKSMFGC